MSDDNKTNEELLEEVKKLRKLNWKFGLVVLINVNLIILVGFYLEYVR
tara:strand:- start:260 stop:403 length:144 start_codon:yes stop_codon:yes gene_type:complete